MPKHAASWTVLAGVLASLVFLPVSVRAQPPGFEHTPPPAPPSPAAGFLTRYDIHVNGLALSRSDPRFSWDVSLGGNIDLVDNGTGRANLLLNYEAVLTDQIRLFQPSQGNYTLEASASYRIGGTEVAALIHHVSRHLSDREQTGPVDWNLVGLRVLREFTSGSTTIDAQANAGGIVRHRYVDYAWRAETVVSLRRLMGSRTTLLVDGSSEAIGVHRSVAGRGTQVGGRLEAGVRLPGRVAAVDLIAGYERRVDAFLFDRYPLSWAFAGFRVIAASRP